MGRIFERAKASYVVLIVCAVGLFGLSAVGQSDGSKYSWIGTTGWVGFNVSILFIVLLTVALGVRALRRRRSRTA